MKAAIGVLAACLGAGAWLAGPPSGTPAAEATWATGVHGADSSRGSWNPKAAAAYLDYRENWWMGWPPAAREHQTFCVSCHSAVPYALARPALRGALAESAPSDNERRLLENVRKRVRLGNDAGLFFTDKDEGAHKADESRGTESVLNALILASDDARSGKLSDDARAAFRNMWAQQQTAGEKSGAWLWLRFNLQPWEADDSGYYGAVLAAVAAGTAPGNYRAAPEIQKNLDLLRQYLDREYPQQSLINCALLLWAGAKWPGLVTAERQAALVGELASQQQPDGGWSLTSLAGPWKRSDGTPLETKSDGYATGLVTFALEQAGLPPSNVHVKQGLAWRSE